MTLGDLLARLDSIDDDATIYAREPWTPESLALVEAEPLAGRVPNAAAGLGMTYFLEASIAKEFVADWEAGLFDPPTAFERCMRVIRFAVQDA